MHAADLQTQFQNRFFKKASYAAQYEFACDVSNHRKTVAHCLLRRATACYGGMLHAKVGWPRKPSPGMRPILIPAFKVEAVRCQNILPGASAGLGKKAVIALDVEFVHWRHGGTNIWTIVPGEVALLTADGVLMHTYIHPGSTQTANCRSRGGVHRRLWRNAPSLNEVAERVRLAATGHILVGHGLTKDLKALGVAHPALLQVDTALLKPFLSRGGQARKLQALSSELLGAKIQTAGRQHSALEDASAVLDLYTKFVEGNTALMDAADLELHLLREIMQHHAEVTRLDD